MRATPRVTRLGEAPETDYLAEPGIHDLAARYLHLAVEASIDLANHWIADQGLRTPDSNRDSFTVLEEAGEIDATLAERMRGWAGFRNVLVHDYIAIDHRIAYAAIPRRARRHRSVSDLGAGEALTAN